MEDEGRIGTELTTEGSKPIERLDFAHLTEKAKREGWYDAKGFFERKLAKPEVFDEDRVHTDRLENLRMPKPNVNDEEIRALTTLLVGSVDPPFPAKYLYTPAGAARDIQAGWWLVTKYNCTGCHVIRAGQTSSLMSVPRYKDPDWKDQLPPSLIGEGARANPEWLARFLENPALSQTDTNRNGVRTYLKAHMPTFYFSPDEIRTLVRFFGALSDQAQPYLPAGLPPLTPQERQMARELFTSPGAPCLKCHATGDKTHDERATAPNFLLASGRLKPAWTKRWLLDPSRIAPGTAMPSGLFRKEGDRWVFSLLLLGIIFPYEATVIPLYYDFQDFGILNTYWSLILPQIGQSVAFGTFWMRAFFRSTPPALVEAGRMDGASSFGILVRVLLPQARPALLTLCALVFTYTWNEFLLALVLVSGAPSKQTAPLGLSFFAGAVRAGDPTKVAAASVLVAAPIVIVYIFLQRHFIRGMLAGAVKG